MLCSRCRGTGLEAPSGQGLAWGDLLVDRATGEVVTVRYMAARRMVVWSLDATGPNPRLPLTISDVATWRERYVLIARRR